MKNHAPPASFWLRRWTFKQNSLILASLWIIGFGLEFLTYQPDPIHSNLKLAYPHNLWAMGIPLLFWALLPWFPFGIGKRIIRWTTDHHFALVVLGGIALLLMFAATIPDQNFVNLPDDQAWAWWFKRLGLTNITGSFPWIFTLILALQSHFFICLKKCRHLIKKQHRGKTLASLLMHGGSFLVLLFAAVGAGDLTRVKMELEKDKIIYEGVNEKNQERVTLPFALELKNFDVQFFAPELVVIDESGPAKILKKWGDFKSGQTLTWKHYQLTVTEFIPHAIEFSGKLHNMDHPGAAPLITLKLINQQTQQGQTLQLTPGSHLFAAKSHTFADLKNIKLILAHQKPKKFVSQLNYYTENKETGRYSLMVNHPLPLLSHWRIYQHSYDEQLGKFSPYSTIEAIYDPWIPFIYTGLILLMVGSLGLLWFARGQHTLGNDLPLALASRWQQRLRRLQQLFTIAAGCYLAWLWWTLERPPLKTLGETRLWYIFLLPLLGLMIDARLKSRWVATYAWLLALLFAVLCLLHPESFDKTLAPALQSPWFAPHVIVYMVAYALLAVATLFAARAFWKKRSLNLAEPLLSAATDLVYVGFALLTLGLLFGAFWAKTAWGHYWSWDPKETWALFTWILYLLFLHLRLFRPRAIEAGHLILIFNFFFLLICWFGMNALPIARYSVHAYSN